MPLLGSSFGHRWSAFGLKRTHAWKLFQALVGADVGEPFKIWWVRLVLMHSILDYHYTIFAANFLTRKMFLPVAHPAPWIELVFVSKPKKSKTVNMYVAKKHSQNKAAKNTQKFERKWLIWTSFGMMWFGLWGQPWTTRLALQKFVVTMNFGAMGRI